MITSERSDEHDDDDGSGGLSGVLLSTRGALEGDAVSVVQDAIADGVGDGGVREVIMPFVRRDLARDDRGAVTVAILDDFEHVAALLLAERSESPIIEHEHFDASELGEQPRVRSVGVRERELLEQARDAAVVGAEAETARLLVQARRRRTVASSTPVAPVMTTLRCSCATHVHVAS